MTADQDEHAAAAAINVLLVDDEHAITSEILEFLSMEGIPATTATDGSGAVREMRAAGPGAFTVVVTDVNMPGKDGISLAQDILAGSPEEWAVEIIIMTGRNSEDMVFQALRSRPFGFFRKPFRLAELVDAILLAHDAAIARRRGRPPTQDSRR